MAANTPGPSGPRGPGFRPGSQVLRANPNKTPTSPSEKSDPVPSPGQEQRGAELAAEPALDQPGGLRGAGAWLRGLASGERKPLGSPEGRGHLLETPTTGSSSTTKSVSKRAVVDALAVSIRTATGMLDDVLGERLERDFQTTAQESLEIAAPLAGYVIDRFQESEVVGEALGRPGLVGAAVRAAGYLWRVCWGRPGGKSESGELADRVARRLAKAEARQAAEQAQEAAEEPVAEENAVARLLGEED